MNRAFIDVIGNLKWHNTKQDHIRAVWKTLVEASGESQGRSILKICHLFHLCLPKDESESFHSGLPVFEKFRPNS